MANSTLIPDGQDEKQNQKRDPGQRQYKRLTDRFDPTKPDTHNFKLAPDGDEPETGAGSDEPPRHNFGQREDEAAGGAPDDDTDTDTIRQREVRGDLPFDYMPDEDEDEEDESGGKKYSRFNPLKRKRNATLATIVMFIGTTGLISGLLGPAGYLIQLKEQLMDKYDRLTSLQQPRSNRIALKQLSEDPMTAGCGVVKVKCRYKGMTDRQIRKIKNRNPTANIEVETDGKNTFGRNRVKSVTLTNDKGQRQTVLARDFKRVIKRDTSAARMIFNYNKSAVAAWRDKQAGKVYVKLKLSLAKVRKARGPPQTDDEIRKAAEDKRQANLDRRAQVSAKYRGIIRKVDLISTLCAIKGLFKVAQEAVKVKQGLDMAKFAFNYLNGPDTMKSGDATGDAGTSNNLSQLATDLTTPDENGNTAADSFGANLMNGYIINDKGAHDIYKLGLDSEKGFFGRINNASQGVPYLEEMSDLVGHVLNPLVCGVAGGLSALACFITGGVGCVVSAVAVAALIQVAMPLILKHLIKSPEIVGAVGGNAGNIIYGGTGYLDKTNNQYHGGYPLDKNQAKKYDQFSDKAQGGGTYTGSGIGAAFDLHEPKSFAGKLAASVWVPVMKMRSSASSAPTTLAGFMGSSLSQIATTSATAREVIPGEYDQCDDAEYKQVEVATDPFCVPQYGLDPSMVLGDDDYNDVAAAPQPSPPASIGSVLTSFFTSPSASALDDTRNFTPDNRFDAERVIDFMLAGKPWIDGDGQAIAHDDVDDDFADYTEKCLETTEPLSSGSPDMCKPKKCFEATATSDTFRWCMFSQYALDTSINDQLEDIDASGQPPADDETTAGAAQTGPSEVFEGSGQEAAAALLANSGVTISDDRGLVQAMADGGESPLDERLIKVLAGLAKNHSFTISSLYRGPCGGSHHCEGKASDISRIDDQTISYNGHNKKIQLFILDAAKLLVSDCENGVPNQEYVTRTNAGGSACQVFVDRGSGPHVHLATGD